MEVRHDDHAILGVGLSWSVVYVANLLVPLFFGLGVTAHGGRVGMVAAVVMFWLLGLWAGRYTVLHRSWLIGGTVVAVAQVFPMLQMGAGLFALSVWTRWTDGVSNPHSAQLSELGGYVVTVLVAAQLLTAALIIGRGTLVVVPRLR